MSMWQRYVRMMRVPAGVGVVATGVVWYVWDWRLALFVFVILVCGLGAVWFSAVVARMNGTWRPRY